MISSYFPRLVLAAIILLGATLRFWQVHESLWLDELHTAWAAADAWSDVAARAAQGNQSPLFFWLTWSSLQCFGESEWALRLPSLLAGIALLPTLYLLVRQGTGSTAAGLLAAGLAAIDRDCIFYSQEARPYALLQLVAAAHLWCLSRMMETPTWRWRTFVVLGAAAMFHLHYTAALLLLAEGVYFLSRTIGPKAWRCRYRWSQATMDVDLVAILCLPAMGNVLAIAARRANWAVFIPQTPLDRLGTIFPLAYYLLAPLGLLAVSWAIAALLTRSVSEGQAARSHYGLTFFQAGLLFACWLLLPLVFAWIATEQDWARLCTRRFLMASAAGQAALAAWLMAACRGKFAQSLAAIAVLSLVVYQSGMISQYRYDGRLIGDRRQDWRGAVEWIQKHETNPGRPVFLHSGLIESRQPFDKSDPQLRSYCLFPISGIYRLQQAPEQLTPLPLYWEGRLDPEELERTIEQGGCWLVLLSAEPRYLEFAAMQVATDLLRAQAKPSYEHIHAFGEVLVCRVAAER